MHSDLRFVAGLAFDLVLAKPIIDAVMEQHPAAVRVDGHRVIVEPDLPGTKRLRRRGNGDATHQ